MTTPLSYLEFVAVFVAAPAVALLAVGVGVERERRREAFAGTVLMLVVALSYTTPWDNLLIAEGVWSYGTGVVAGRVWLAPVGEYLFIALQTVLAALWLYRRPLPSPAPGSGRAAAGADADPGGPADADGPAPIDPDADGTTPAGAAGADSERDPEAGAGAGAGTGRPVPDGGEPGAPARSRPRASVPDGVRWALPGFAGAAVFLGLALLGVLALSGGTYYLGAIVAWAGPVLALQWAVGGRYLLSVRRHLLWAILPPTLYLCTVDRLAIGWGLWTISPEYSTGLTVLGLPVEEATFFLLTTTMIAQGLVLFHWVLDLRPWRGR